MSAPIFIGANCYDFVDAVIDAGGYPPNYAFNFVEPGSPIYNYGLMQSWTIEQWFGIYQQMAQDENYAYYMEPIIRDGKWVVDAVGSEDEVLITARYEQAVNETYMSPIAIDLGGDGFSIIDLQHSEVHFDYGDGAVHTAWLGPDDGFLVMDENQDGDISDINEMFGGRNANDAFDKLSLLDGNGDGVIDASDFAWEKLQIWKDTNSDGCSSENELFSLTELNVQSLSLDRSVSGILLNDAIIGEQSTASVNGSSVALSDVFFRVDTVDAAYV